MKSNQADSITLNKTRGMFFFLFIVCCGLGVRLLDLKDPPLDYAATRQLRSALIARGMYYQWEEDAPQGKRETAIKQGQHSMIEPLIMETLVAGAYWLTGSENVWIARIYSSIFWTLGGAGLFFLLKEMVSINGAYVGLIYYLFNPFGLVASRTFQPDPLMTALVVITLWLFYRWYQTSSWKWSLLTGLSAGATMMVKSTAVFFLLGGMAVVVLRKKSLRETWKDGQVWAMAVISGVPVLLYHLYGLVLVGTLGQQFQGRFFPELLLDKTYYLGWEDSLATVAGHEVILIAGLGGVIYFLNKKEAAFLGGIWAGYVIYSIFFTYHITTHDYYHLPVIPLLAIFLAGLSELLFTKINLFDRKGLIRAGLVVAVLMGTAGGAYLFFRDDYRHEPDFYYQVANAVPEDSRKIVLSQDYGNRITYYGWITPRPWKDPGGIDYSQPYSENGEAFSQYFESYTMGFDYFIITQIKLFQKNEYLYRYLNEQYPVAKKGGGYIIFDLTSKGSL